MEKRGKRREREEGREKESEGEGKRVSDNFLHSLVREGSVLEKLLKANNNTSELLYNLNIPVIYHTVQCK